MDKFTVILARKEKGLSQRKLAKLAKLSPSTVSRYEMGLPTRLESVIAMYEALGLVQKDNHQGTRLGQRQLLASIGKIKIVLQELEMIIESEES